MRILDRAMWTTAAPVLVAALLVGPAGPAWADPSAPTNSADTASPAPAEGQTPSPAGASAPNTKASAPAKAGALTEAGASTADNAAAVPHLSSPQNLPPYTTNSREGSQDPDRLSYFRDVWQAIRNGEVTPKQALVLIAQRPMDPNAAPPPGMPKGPQAPVPDPGPAPDVPLG